MPKDELSLPRMQVLYAQLMCGQLRADVVRINQLVQEALPNIIEEAVRVRLHVSFIGTQMFWNALFEACNPQNNDDVLAIIAKGNRAIRLYKKRAGTIVAQKQELPDGVFRIVARARVGRRKRSS